MSDALYERASQLLEEAEPVDLTLLVVTTNSWKRQRRRAHDRRQAGVALTIAINGGSRGERRQPSAMRGGATFPPLPARSALFPDRCRLPAEQPARVAGTDLGAVVGLPAFAVFHALGLPFIVNSPVAAALTLLFFGTVAGLMLGGLVALRPEERCVRQLR